MGELAACVAGSGGVVILILMAPARRQAPDPPWPPVSGILPVFPEHPLTVGLCRFWTTRPRAVVGQILSPSRRSGRRGTASRLHVEAEIGGGEAIVGDNLVAHVPSRRKRFAFGNRSGVTRSQAARDDLAPQSGASVCGRRASRPCPGRTKGVERLGSRDTSI